MKASTIAILGITKNSASVALALKDAASDLKFIGHDPSLSTMKLAVELGVCQKTMRSVQNAAAAADIILMDLPAADAAEIWTLVGPSVPDHGVILDLSMGKSRGVELSTEFLAAGHYIGFHPIGSAAQLLGDDGWLESANKDLFRKSTVALILPANADSGAVKTAETMSHVIGATPFFMDAAEYDSLVQAVVTLPSLIAVALLKCSTEALAWRDLRRIAGPEFARSTEAVESDAFSVMTRLDKVGALLWLDRFQGELAGLREVIDEGDPDAVRYLLESLRETRRKWMSEREQNDWTEVSDMPTQSRGLIGGMLGLGSK